MPRLFISLGTNIDREENLRAAVAALRKAFADLRVSTVYESRAVGFEGDNFYNAVAVCSTNLDIPATIATLNFIEASLGRKRGPEKYSPRTIDLDLLMYGDAVVDDGRVRLPRDEITRYAFVLRPLAEIAPTTLHPRLGVTFGTLWEQFPAGEAALWPVRFSA